MSDEYDDTESIENDGPSEDELVAAEVPDPVEEARAEKQAPRQEPAYDPRDHKHWLTPFVPEAR